MSNHTPGPWGVEYDGSLVMGRQVVPTPSPDTASVEERKANARLIAAAPDLLDALEALIPLVEWALKEQSPPYFDGPLVVQSCVAIAKAKGETT